MPICTVQPGTCLPSIPGTSVILMQLHAVLGRGFILMMVPNEGNDSGAVKKLLQKLYFRLVPVLNISMHKPVMASHCKFVAYYASVPRYLALIDPWQYHSSHTLKIWAHVILGYTSNSRIHYVPFFPSTFAPDLGFV